MMKVENHHLATIAGIVNQTKLSMNAKTTGLKSDEEQNSYIVSKHLSRDYLLITKEKVVLLKWLKLEDITLTK